MRAARHNVQQHLISKQGYLDWTFESYELLFVIVQNVESCVYHMFLNINTQANEKWKMQMFLTMRHHKGTQNIH